MAASGGGAARRWINLWRQFAVFLQPITAGNSGCFRCYSAAIILKRRGIPRSGVGGPCFFARTTAISAASASPVVPKLASTDSVALLVGRTKRRERDDRG